MFDKKNKDKGGIEMEFDNIGGLQDGKKEEPKMEPPPLQDSKDYYNSTQRMTEAMK